MTHKILLRGLGVHITYQRSTVTYTALILFYLNLPKCHCGLTFCAWDEDSALSGLKLTTSLHIYFSVLLLLALSFFSNCPPSFLPFYHSHLWSLLVCLLITPFPLISSLMPVSAVQGNLRLRQWFSSLMAYTPSCQNTSLVQTCLTETLSCNTLAVTNLFLSTLSSSL